MVTFGVQGRTMCPPEVLGEEQVLAAYVEHTGAQQTAAVAAPGAEAPADVETAVATGRSWVEAIGAIAWDRTDVLVVGSSSASLMQRLFLGSSAAKIVRASPAPVVVVP